MEPETTEERQLRLDERRRHKGDPERHRQRARRRMDLNNAWQKHFLKDIAPSSGIELVFSKSGKNPSVNPNVYPTRLVFDGLPLREYQAKWIAGRVASDSTLPPVNPDPIDWLGLAELLNVVIEAEDGAPTVQPEDGYAASFLTQFESVPSRDAEFPSLNKRELTLQAYAQNCLCKGCGKPLGGAWRSKDSKLAKARTVQMHVPSKAFARAHGLTLAKDNIFAGHACCNAMHAAKIIPVELMSKATAAEHERRRIELFPPERIGTREISIVKNELYVLEEKAAAAAGVN